MGRGAESLLQIKHMITGQQDVVNYKHSEDKWKTRPQSRLSEDIKSMSHFMLILHHIPLFSKHLTESMKVTG